MEPTTQAQQPEAPPDAASAEALPGVAEDAPAEAATAPAATPEAGPGPEPGLNPEPGPSLEPPERAREFPTGGLVVALDGPASSGKSSVGAAAAAQLGYRFCDTGLLYRAVTWLAIRRNVWPEDAPGLVRLVDEVRLAPDDGGRLRHVTIDGIDETDAVHGPDVDALVSAVARVPEVRAALLARQRRIAQDGRIVMAGRDIGTVVLPDADLKIYLDATLHERARRRTEERHIDPGGRAANEVLAELRRRDIIDSTRAVAPLRIPDDAIVLRTDGNTFEQTVALVVRAIQVREQGLQRGREGGRAEVRASRGADDAGAARAGSGAGRRSPPKAVPIASRINWFRVIGGTALRSIARLLVRIRVEGDLSVIPREGPLIIASNHASSADPVLIGAFLNQTLGRPLNWLGKRELVEIPVIGWFMRQVPIHPVDRATADLEAFRVAMRILESGNILAVFPEGTRSETGELQQAKDGAAVLALRSGAPVLPVAVGDSDRVWPKHARVPRPGHTVTVRYGVPFRVAEELPVAPAAMDRRTAKEAATALIMARIAELLPERQRGVYRDAVGGPKTAETAVAPELPPPG